MVYLHNISPSSVREEKKALRKDFRLKRANLDKELKKKLDDAICENVRSLTAYRYANTVLSFSPLPDEINIYDLNTNILLDGKTFALPRCIPGTKLMDFKIVEHMSDLEKGSYSILEPKRSNTTWIQKDNESVICIVPAMSFDTEGFRLGYGKGFYDRFLRDKIITKIGIIYDDFILPRLPRGNFDLPCDIIVTESKIFRPEKSKFSKSSK